MALFLLAVMTIGITEQAQAEDTDPATQARVYNLKGNAAFKRGDDVAAREFYQKSLALHESFDAFCKVGRVEESLKLLSDAYFNLGMCLRLYPADEELQAAREKYDALRAEVRAKLTPEQMAAIDRKVKERKVIAPAGGAESTPVDTEMLDPTETAGDEPTSSEVQPALVDPGLDDVPTPVPGRLPVVLSLAGLGAASAGVGVGFLVSSISKRKDANAQRDRMVDEGVSCASDDSPSSCDKLDELFDTAERNRTLAIILTASGGALLAGSALLYFLWPDKKTESALRPHLLASPWTGDLQLGLSGRF